MANKNKPKYLKLSTPAKVKPYKSTVATPKAYTPGQYTSQYADQISAARDNVINFKYDPMQDAKYQALAKIYGARGNQAAKDTLGDAAALNGGYASSYAVSAAQQARNQYNQELAALIPDLEANAYNRAQTTYNTLMDADDTDYGRFRDTEGDRQWQYTQAYQAYRDKEADNQWAYTQQYNAMRDAVADYQWALGYNTDLYQYNKAQAKSSGGGGGGRRRRSGGGGSGYSGSSSSSSGIPLSAEDFAKAQQEANSGGTKKKKAATGGGGKKTMMYR